MSYLYAKCLASISRKAKHILRLLPHVFWLLTDYIQTFACVFVFTMCFIMYMCMSYLYIGFKILCYIVFWYCVISIHVRTMNKALNLIWLVGLMAFNAIFNNFSVISWRSAVAWLVEETGENHRPVASHWQTLSHNVAYFALIEIRTNNISGDGHWLHG